MTTVERIRRLYCTQSESIDFYYRLLANDPSTVASPTYVVGSLPPQALELQFHPPVAAPVEAEGDAARLSANVPAKDVVLPSPPVASSTDDDVAHAPPAPLQRSRSLQEEEFALVDVQGTLEVVCDHLGLRYVKSSGGDAVKFVLDSPDGERSFSYANLPFRRLLEDSRMVHPVYARGIVQQRYYECMLVECTDEPADPITNGPGVLMANLILPLLVKPEPGRMWVNDEHAHFQSALATVTDTTWEPFQSSISFDQWLPRRLLRKLCRRAGCPMESSAALMELRTELRKFLEAWLTVASHELQTQQTHRQESSIIITCDTLLRCLPRLLLYGGNRAELRVFGYGVAGNIRHVLGPQIQMVLIQVHPWAMLEEVAMSVVHDLVVTTMLDVARCAKAQSTQRGHRRATVHCGHPAPAEASKLRPWEYSVYEVQPAEGEGGDPDDDAAAVTVVTMDDVLAAMHTLLPTPLTEQILRECTRALSRYHQQRENTANGVIPVPGMEIRSWIGLTFAPELIALIVDTFFGVGDVCLTIEALISLTATAELLAAKLFELSGNVAKEEDDHSDIIIAPHHLSMAILRENTLRALYPGCWIRYGYGGCCGHVPPANTLHAFTLVTADPNTTWIRTVDAYLASTVVATGAAVPHVLCGGYIGPPNERGGDGGDDVPDVTVTEPPYMWMPVLDGLAYPKLGEAKRQLMAIEAAPAEVQQAVKHLGADPASTWQRRLFELQREERQRSMFPLFTYETMFALSSQVMQDIGPPTTAMFTTTDAVDLLATVSESLMVALVKDAFSVALKANRVVLGPVDIQMAMARRLRGGAHA